MTIRGLDREGRLWLCAVAILLLIVVNLFFGAAIAAKLQVWNAIGPVTFSAGMVLVAAAVIAHGLAGGARLVAMAVSLAVLSVGVLTIARMTSPAERTHLIEYGALALVVFAALLARRDNGRTVPAPAIIAIAIVVCVGVADECVQAFLPSRVFDPVDIMFNAAAATGAVVVSTVVRVARAWFSADL